jgi:O-antigen/teichoic acid export membrane protein
VVAAGMARILAVASTLAVVPLALNYLGSDRYGLWVAIGSFTAMLTFADLGLGNGLVNAIAEANGRGDRDAARQYVSSGFMMLVGVSLVLAAVFAVLYGAVDWGQVFNSRGSGAAEAAPTVAVFVGCTALALPFGLVSKIQMGYQEMFAVSLWSGLGSIFRVGGVVVAIHLGAGLPWLVLALAGGPVLASVLCTMTEFGFRRRWLMPALEACHLRTARRLLGVGLTFVVLQLTVAFAYNLDPLIAARVIGPSAATLYAVPLQLFGLAPTLVSLLLYPLWPAYGEALARGDLAWVRRALKFSTAISLAVTGTASVALLIFGREVLRLWVGSQVDPSFWLLAGFAAWAVLSNAFATVGTLLNGATLMRFQVLTALVMAPVSVVLSVVMANWIGVTGVIWGTVIAYAFCSAIPTIWYLPRAFRELERRTASGHRLYSAAAE